MRMNVMKACLIFTIAMLSAAPVMAQTLTILFEEWPPYEFTRDGTIQGTDVDVVQEVCKRLGLAPQFQSVPWARALKDVKTGDADALFSAAYTEERSAFLYYPTIALSAERNVLFAKTENPVRVAQLRDLKGLKIGIVRGYVYTPEFDAYAEAEKISGVDQEAALRLLINDRVDVVICSDVVGAALIKTMGIAGQVKILDYVVFEEPLYIAFSKAKGAQAQQLAEQFSQVLQELQTEGFIAQVWRKYQE